jgi:hypothetical protein
MDTPDQQIRRIVVDRMDRCAVCHRRFEEDDVEVISRKPDVWLMIIQCQDCHSRSFAAAVIGDQTTSINPASLFGFASDGALEITFETDEEDEGTHTSPVDVDDVLRMHEFLATFDGDFKSLFGHDIDPLKD